MKLYIARHGQASFDAASDFERPLTELGIKQTQVLVEQNLSELEDVEMMWCSQLRRAKETAKVFEKALGLKAVEQSFLTPDSDLNKVLRELRKLDVENLLIVSHQPLVGELVSMLTAGNPYQAHPYTTSEVVVLEMELIEAGLATMSRNFIPS